MWQAAPTAGTNVVDVYVNYLRKKLGTVRSSTGGEDRVIDTVRGEGYAMALDGGRKDAAGMFGGGQGWRETVAASA